MPPKKPKAAASAEPSFEAKAESAPTTVGKKKPIGAQKKQPAKPAVTASQSRKKADDDKDETQQPASRIASALEAAELGIRSRKLTHGNIMGADAGSAVERIASTLEVAAASVLDLRAAGGRGDDEDDDRDDNVKGTRSGTGAQKRVTADRRVIDGVDVLAKLNCRGLVVRQFTDALGIMMQQRSQSAEGAQQQQQQ
jgi:hypothetical protein